MRILSGTSVIVLMLVVNGLSSEPVSRDTIESTRTVIEKWVETQRLISVEKQNWVLAQQSLNDRIAMVRNEIDSLHEKITKGRQDVNEADKNQAKLFEENEQLKKASETLNGIITKIESKTLFLNSQLPDPLRERIKPLSQRIPKDFNETKESLSQRFQNIIGILNELNKFNHEITVTSEVQKLSDGTSVEVTAMYVGLGQAYYVNANGTIAGVGCPSEKGWSWEPANEAAGKIMDAINILKNEKVASFVPLPVKVK
jgi:FtsZ-binding cell division protein ZapB